MDTTTVSKIIKKIGDVIPYTGSFVGVDIGSSSIKIVQLSMIDNDIVLETYGEISNTPYDVGQAPGKTSDANPAIRSAELSDLLHEVDAQSRRCGVAVPLSESFINVIDLPKRDPEQMRRLVPAEVQKFIPISVDKLMIDWYPVKEEESSVFDVLVPNKQTEAHFQKVIVVAVNNDSAYRLGQIAKDSRLEPAFFEIEMFSAARACIHTSETPALLLDLGATSTKAYILNERRVPVDARVIPVGGASLTEEIGKARSCDPLAAERIKCEQGLAAGSEVHTTIESALAPIWTYVEQMFEEQKKRESKPIERIFLAGGGSYMPGIIELVASKLSLPVELIRAFDRTKGPMILEHTLREDGPRFAVAVGLALRGLGR